jgi:hypothetical protein
MNAPLWADEQQLWRKTQGDVLDRLLKIIEEKKKEYSEWLSPPKQPAEHAELERSDTEASGTGSGGDGSEEG